MRKGLTWVYLGDITKSKDAKGNLIVKGVATSSRLDADDQICEAEWLQKAINDWFTSGANMRLMHDKRAVGKGIELEWTEDGKCLLTSKCVDTDAQRLIEEDVLMGMSIGIKNARVIKSAKAKGGLICDGTIPEISYVDRPANYDALFMKGLGFGENPHWAEEDDPDVITVLKCLDIVKTEMGEDDNDGDSATDDAECEDCCDTGWLSVDEPCPSCNADGEKSIGTDEFGWTTFDKDAWSDLQKALAPDIKKKQYTMKQRLALAAEGKAMPGGGFPIADEADLENAIQSIGRAKDPVKAKAFIKRRAKELGAGAKIPTTWKSLGQAVEDMFDVLKAIPAFEGVIVKGSDADTWLHDPNVCASIVAGLVEMLSGELNELLAGEDERWDIQDLVHILTCFLSWQSSEAYDGETKSPFGQGEDEDDMVDSLVTMGVDPELVKAAKADDATPEAKDALLKSAREILAPGLDTMLADYEAVQAILTKSGSKSLAEELANIREMATPGGPYVGPAKQSAELQKGSEAERLVVDLIKYRRMASTVNEPGMAQEYSELANETYDRLMSLGVEVPAAV